MPRAPKDKVYACPHSSLPLDFVQAKGTEAVMVVSPHGWMSRIFPNKGVAAKWILSSLSLECRIEPMKDSRGFVHYRAVGHGWTGPLLPFESTAQRWASFRAGVPTGEFGAEAVPAKADADPVDELTDSEAEEFVKDMDAKLGIVRKK